MDHFKGLKRNIIPSLLFILFCLTGCSHLHREDLPEYIYLCPEVNAFKHSKVGVFQFKAPAHANGTGKAAAEAVFDDLLKKGVFSYLSNETKHGVMGMRNSLELARSGGYDLMITGEVLHYFDGSELLPSRVTEKIQVVHVASQRVLWVAKAEGLANPDPSIDFLLFQTSGGLAKPALALIEENADKFGNLLLLKPLQSDTAETGKDIMLSAHQAIFDGLRQEVDGLSTQNEQLETRLSVETAKSNALQKEVGELSLQTDQLDRQLKEELEKGEVTLKRYTTKTIVNMDSRICFDLGSAVLKKKAKETLIKLSKALTDIPNSTVHIEGHTDNVPIRKGRFASNWELSSARALAVLRYLSNHGNIAPERLSATGYGEYQPIVPNDSIQNKRLNRRVDIVIVPNRTELTRKDETPPEG